MSTNTNEVSLFDENEASWHALSKLALQRYSHRIPKYLFRAWCKSSGGGNGRYNTPERIAPSGYFIDPNCVSGMSVFRNLSQARFAEMTLAHLNNDFDVPTQFSSWSQHLSVALVFGQDLDSGFDADMNTTHISIIDTDLLRRTNQIFHVPDIGVCLASGDPAYRTFREEYLAHGIIENSAAHLAVPLSTLRAEGLLTWYPECQNNDYVSSPGKLSSFLFPFDMDWMTIIYNMSRPYDGPAGFRIVFCIALLTLHRVDEHLFANGVPQKFLEAFGSCFSFQSIPDWSTSRAIMNDDFFQHEAENDWEDVKQMVRMMRAIQNPNWCR